jgi:hypothetical protein
MLLLTMVGCADVARGLGESNEPDIEQLTGLDRAFASSVVTVEAVVDVHADIDVSSADVDASAGDSNSAEPELEAETPDVVPIRGEPVHVFVHAPDAWVECHAGIGESVLACANETIADAFAGVGEVGAWLEAMRWCTDAEWVIGARDAVCDEDSVRQLWCDEPVETYMNATFVECERELVGAVYASSHLLAGQWMQGRRQPGVRLVDKGTVWRIDGLSDADKAQLAVAFGAFPGSTEEDTDLDTELGYAMDELSEFSLLRIHLWDISNRRPLDVWTWTMFGEEATNGIVFEGGETRVLGTIADEVVNAIDLDWGDEGRVCLEDADCADLVACVGAVRGMFAGQCVDYAEDFELQSVGDACMADTERTNDCPAGLLCSGVIAESAGQCLPAWMRRTVEQPGPQSGERAVPEGERDPLLLPLMMTGTATVSTDVWIRIGIRHPDISQLRVTLTNPDGTESTVLDEPPAQVNYYRYMRLTGFPGDESSNGQWLLRVEDNVIDGSGGMLEEAVLTVGSRWD